MPIIPSPDTAPHRLIPDMRGFSATPAPIGVGSLHLRLHCLSRMGCGQSGKVSKTVNSCAALLRCVARPAGGVARSENDTGQPDALTSLGASGKLCDLLCTPDGPLAAGGGAAIGSRRGRDQNASDAPHGSGLSTPTWQEWIYPAG